MSVVNLSSTPTREESLRCFANQKVSIGQLLFTETERSGRSWLDIWEEKNLSRFGFRFRSTLANLIDGTMESVRPDDLTLITVLSEFLSISKSDLIDALHLRQAGQKKTVDLGSPKARRSALIRSSGRSLKQAERNKIEQPQEDVGAKLPSSLNDAVAQLNQLLQPIPLAVCQIEQALNYPDSLLKTALAGNLSEQGTQTIIEEVSRLSHYLNADPQEFVGQRIPASHKKIISELFRYYLNDCTLTRAEIAQKADTSPQTIYRTLACGTAASVALTLLQVTKSHQGKAKQEAARQRAIKQKEARQQAARRQAAEQFNTLCQATQATTASLAQVLGVKPAVIKRFRTGGGRSTTQEILQLTTLLEEKMDELTEPITLTPAQLQSAAAWHKWLEGNGNNPEILRQIRRVLLKVAKDYHQK